jgi:hypothetical protein
VSMQYHENIFIWSYLSYGFYAFGHVIFGGLK